MKQWSIGDAWVIHKRFLQDIKEPHCWLWCNVSTLCCKLQVASLSRYMVGDFLLVMIFPLKDRSIMAISRYFCWWIGRLVWGRLGSGEYGDSLFCEDIIGPRRSLSSVMAMTRRTRAIWRFGWCWESHEDINLRVSTIIDGDPKGKILSMDGEPNHYRLWSHEQ